MSRLIYLAAPADQAGRTVPGREVPWWRSELHRISYDLSEAGCDVYRPTVAFAAGQRGAAVQSVNRAALAAAGGGVALVPAGVPTLGVPAEVEQMLVAGLPVCIVTDLEDSVQLRDWESRGAGVVRPTGEGISVGLLQLRHLMQELKPDYRTITFEPVDDMGDAVASRWDVRLLPSRGYPGDAGLDLVVSEDTEIPPGAFVDVPCGVKVDLPAGHFGMIVGRSSTLRKRGLLVSTGVIDEGWTGPLFAGVQNMSSARDFVKAGERLAQLLILPAPGAGLVPVWGKVPDKERGTNGFGSTGA